MLVSSVQQCESTKRILIYTSLSSWASYQHPHPITFRSSLSNERTTLCYTVGSHYLLYFLFVFYYFFSIGGKSIYSGFFFFPCQTAKQISHNHTYISSFLNFPPFPPTNPSRSSRRTRLGSLCFIATSHHLQLSNFTQDSVYMSMLFSLWIPFSPSPTEPTSLFSTFASPFFPCK